MPGTVRRIIDRIKDQRSSGNSVVALTVETRLVLQGFDPQRFEYDTPDDPGRLARIEEIAGEMGVEIADLMAAADAEPDPEVAPAPPPSAQETLGGDSLSQSAQDAARAAGIGRDAGGGGTRAGAPNVPEDHPLREFRRIADEALAEAGEVNAGSRSGASFPVLVKSSLLIGLYSITSDRVFCDLLRYNTLFTWFLGITAAQADFDPEAFAADRDEALATSAAQAFFDRIVLEGGRHKLFSRNRLQPNGRQIKGWMSQRARA
jgi:transposase